MNRLALLASALAVSLNVYAADSAFMTLRWGGHATQAPEAGAQLLQALNRYPSCFDSLSTETPPDTAFAEALEKLGVQSEQGTRDCSCGLPDDHAPRDMISHALLFAAQSTQTVANVGNGRGTASGKSAHGLCVEAMLLLAYGAERIEFDLMGYGHEPVSWYANTYLSELTLWRPFFQAYARHNQGTRPGGILPFCGKNGTFKEGAFPAADALAPLGLPVCPGSPYPSCYLLTAESVATMNDVELQRVLSGGVILDGGAVAKLQERNYGEKILLTAKPRAPQQIRELFTDDELNVNRVGHLWRPAATEADTFALIPSDESARVIGRYESEDGKAAEAASVLIELPTGGRIAVFGFAGFSRDASEARRRQLLLAADWVAQNRLPVFVENAAQIVAVPRVSMAGDLCSVAVLNAAIDTQPPPTLRLRGCRKGLEQMEWLTPKEKPVTLAVRWEDKDALVTLPAIAPWQIGWLRPVID